MARPAILEALRAPAADRGGDLATAAWAAFLRKAKRPDEADRILKANPAAARVFENGGRVDKADQTVGATGAGSWGANLTQSAVGSFFSALTGQSAGAQLIRAAGAHVDLAPLSSISFPRSAAAPPAVNWIGEGDPIPVDEHAFGEDVVGPEKKFGVIMTFTRELAKRSAARTVFDAVLRERAAVALDAAIFSAAAGDDVTHSGLLAGLSPVAGHSECVADVTTLLRALGAAGGSGNAAIVCSPANAAEIAVKLPSLRFPVWPSRSVADDKVIALDPTAFAVSFGGVDIEVAESATLHMEDVPAEIVSGTGPTTADPVRDIFQTATLAVRVLVDIAFCQRNSLVVFTESIAWA